MRAKRNKVDNTQSIETKEPVQLNKENQINEIEQPKEVIEQPKEDIEQPKEDIRLFILTDRAINFELPYMRECGLSVVEIYHSIDDVLGVMMFEEKASRVVVIDSGKGTFTSSAGREAVIDMLGSANENFKFTVFYTDSALKEEAKRKLTKQFKQIDWFKYETTPVAIATMLGYNKENFLLTDEEKSDTCYKEDEYIVNYAGDKVTNIEKDNHRLSYIDIINSSTIYSEMQSEDISNDLKSYSVEKEVVKYRKR